MQPIRLKHSLMAIILYRHPTKFSASKGDSHMTLSSDCSSEISQGKNIFQNYPPSLNVPLADSMLALLHIIGTQTLLLLVGHSMQGKNLTRPVWTGLSSNNLFTCHCHYQQPTPNALLIRSKEAAAHVKSFSFIHFAQVPKEGWKGSWYRRAFSLAAFALNTVQASVLLSLMLLHWCSAVGPALLVSAKTPLWVVFSLWGIPHLVLVSNRSQFYMDEQWDSLLLG